MTDELYRYLDRLDFARLKERAPDLMGRPIEVEGREYDCFSVDLERDVYKL